MSGHWYSVLTFTALEACSQAVTSLLMVTRSMSLIDFVTNHQYYDVTMVNVFGELCKYRMLAQEGQRRDYEAEHAVHA